MTVYETLQLNAAGSKNLIKTADTPKEKTKYVLLFILKAALTLLFCMILVTGFSMLFGQENSVAGVVILLMILTFRQADLGIRPMHGSACLVLIFAIFIFGPHAASQSSPAAALVINALCLMAIMILGCHNVIMYNHIILNLCYFLLFGNNVTGTAFTRRTAGLIAGGILTGFIYWLSHRKNNYRRTFQSLFSEFRLSSSRTQWELKIALIVPLCVFTAACLKLPRTMWVAFAAITLLPPLEKDCYYRLTRRAPFNVLGCGLFSLLYLLFPDLAPLMGILGGIGVSFSASYLWQTMFNTFGALSIAVSLFGLKDAIFLRILTNVLGCILAFVLSRLFTNLFTHPGSPSEKPAGA